jgi:hypothetical protein
MHSFFIPSILFISPNVLTSRHEHAHEQHDSMRKEEQREQHENMLHESIHALCKLHFTARSL